MHIHIVVIVVGFVCASLLDRCVHGRLGTKNHTLGFQSIVFCVGTYKYQLVAPILALDFPNFSPWFSVQVLEVKNTGSWFPVHAFVAKKHE